MKLTQINLENVRKGRLESQSIRRKIFPSLIVIVCTSLLLVYLILTVNPDYFWARVAFFLLVFIDVYYIFSVLFIKRGRGLISALVITLALIFKYYGITNVYYYFGLVGAGIVVELIFKFRRH